MRWLDLLYKMLEAVIKWREKWAPTFEEDALRKEKMQREADLGIKRDKFGRVVGEKVIDIPSTSSTVAPASDVAKPSTPVNNG